MTLPNNPFFFVPPASSSFFSFFLSFELMLISDILLLKMLEPDAEFRFCIAGATGAAGGGASAGGPTGGTQYLKSMILLSVPAVGVN